MYTAIKCWFYVNVKALMKWKIIKGNKEISKKIKGGK